MKWREIHPEPLKSHLTSKGWAVFAFLWVGTLSSFLAPYSVLAANRADINRCAALLSGDKSALHSLDEQASHSWTPELQTLKGRVDLLVSILGRHPQFVTSNLSFRRNVLDTLAHIPRIAEILGERMVDLTIRPPQVLSARFSRTAVVYDEAALSRFRQSRVQDLSQLELLPGGDLEAQLVHYKQNKKNLKIIFRLLPFLFDSGGRIRFAEGGNWEWNEATRRSVQETIKQSGAAEWENGYFDTLREHIDPLLEAVFAQKGMGGVKQHYQSVRNQFIERDVRQAIRLQSQQQSQGAAPFELRTLSIEEIPGSVAVARGCYGGDCSILSVPFYALLKGVHVYFIRKVAGSHKNT